MAAAGSSFLDADEIAYLRHEIPLGEAREACAELGVAVGAAATRVGPTARGVAEETCGVEAAPTAGGRTMNTLSAHAIATALPRPRPPYRYSKYCSSQK